MGVGKSDWWRHSRGLGGCVLLKLRPVCIIFHLIPKRNWKRLCQDLTFTSAKYSKLSIYFFLLSETQSEWLWRSFSLLGSEIQRNERAACWPGFSTYGFRKVLWESAAEIDKNPHSCVIKGTERAPRVAAVCNSRPLKGTCSPWEHREGLGGRKAFWGLLQQDLSPVYKGTREADLQPGHC